MQNHRAFRKPVNPFATTIAVLLFGTTACLFGDTLAPAPGRQLYMEPALFEVAGASVSIPTGNLMLNREDFVIDTQLGPQRAGAFYNSADDLWRFSFDMTHDGKIFTDATGSWHDVSAVVTGFEIPGTHWLKHDAHAVRSRGGLVHTFENGVLQSIHWNHSDYPRLSFASKGIADRRRVYRVEQCLSPGATCLPVFEIFHDSAGNVTRIEDRAGRIAEYTYDGEGRMVAALDPVEVEEGWPGTRYEYTPATNGIRRLAARTNSEQERTEYTYDSAGHLASLRRVGEDDPTYRFSYARVGADLYETTVTRPGGATRTYRYDPFWKLHELENEEGETTTYSWMGFELVSTVDAAARMTRWFPQTVGTTSPGDQKVVVEIQPSGNVVTSIFATTENNFQDPFAYALLSLEDSMGTIETRWYLSHRLFRVTDGAGGVWEYTYGEGIFPQEIRDPTGRRVALSIPNEMGYSGIGVFIDGIYVQPASSVFDAVGNLLEGSVIEEPTDPGRPGIRARGFNANRQIVSLELASTTLETATLTIARRSDGQPLRIARPFGGDTEFDYDTLGRLTQRREKVDGSWQTTTFEHDPEDRLVAVELPNGMRTETVYDQAGRRVELRHLRDGIVEKTVQSTWQNGALVRREDSSYAAPETFSYDEAGRVASIVYPQGETMALAYDLRNRRTEERFSMPDGTTLRTIQREYDAIGRPLALSDEDTTHLAWVYGENDETSFTPLPTVLRSMAYGNGVTRHFVFEAGTGMLRSSRSTKDAQVLEETEIAFEMNCESLIVDTAICITIRESALPTSPPMKPTERYGLSGGSTIQTVLGNGAILTRPFAGSRVEASGFERVGGHGEPEVIAQYYYGYDVLGNMLWKNDSSFEYNSEHNRLLSGAGHTYVYDEAGFVVERDGTPLAWDSTGKIAAYGQLAGASWDSHGRPIARWLGGTQTRYLFGGQVEADAAGNPVALDLLDVRIDLALDEHRYRHLDFRNNVQFVTDQDGAVVQSYRYNAYGVEEVFSQGETGPTFAQGIPLAGLSLLGARVLDADTGRFLSPDPLFQVVNQYSYAEGNPVWLWDPDGQLPKFCEIVTVKVEKKDHQKVPVVEIVCAPACGLGFESGLALLLAEGVRRRRRKSAKRGRQQGGKTT